MAAVITQHWQQAGTVRPQAASRAEPCMHAAETSHPTPPPFLSILFLTITVVPSLSW